VRDDRTCLRHVLECIRRIEEDTACGRKTFLASHTFQDAVLRNLQTMAESIQRFSGRLKELHPEVEWARITAFRNVLVHGYLGIDLARVWGITQQNVPQ
jgi:uncharacterized protein with HEPN domain